MDAPYPRHHRQVFVDLRESKKITLTGLADAPRLDPQNGVVNLTTRLSFSSTLSNPFH
jgi:hypothetical protein